MARFEDLFGPKGACNDCWCVYWRIGSAYRKQPPGENKAVLYQIVKTGPPPGLIAFDGDKAVGGANSLPAPGCLGSTAHHGSSA